LRAGSDLRAWVLTIAHRKALDAHRSRARAPLPVGQAPDAGARFGARSANGASTQAIGELGAPLAGEHDERLWSAVRRLPERQRSAVVLRCLADLSHRQIAAAIDCSEAAARRSLHEGLTRLREAMTDE
jgi:RNA polymerase sigma factor (sigma-70 family)